MTHEYSQSDRRLLDLIQRRVPLVREPYAQIAGHLGRDEQMVLERLAALRAEGGIIRQMSGIFEASALGYSQALVAIAVPADGLDQAGSIVAAHPGVSHCYGRQGDYDLWFTLATSSQSRLGLEKTAEVLAARSGAKSHLVLPMLKRYKLQAIFGPQPAADGPAAQEFTEGPVAPVGLAPRLTDRQIRAIRALQVDLPNRSDPFWPLAAGADLEADELLVQGCDFLAAGYMRRYAAVLRHRLAGAEANVLVAWRVSDSAADSAGARCAQLGSVSHCYLRPAAEHWPYNLYTMIHGRNRRDCQTAIEQIAEAAGLHDRAELWTHREYKKQRVNLFSIEESNWERSAQPST